MGDNRSFFTSVSLFLLFGMAQLSRAINSPTLIFLLCAILFRKSFQICNEGKSVLAFSITRTKGPMKGTELGQSEGSYPRQSRELRTSGSFHQRHSRPNRPLEILVPVFRVTDHNKATAKESVTQVWRLKRLMDEGVFEREMAAIMKQELVTTYHNGFDCLQVTQCRPLSCVLEMDWRTLGGSGEGPDEQILEESVLLRGNKT